MKRIKLLSLLLALSILFGTLLTACGETEPPKTVPVTVNTETAEKTAEEAPEYETLPNRLKVKDVENFPLANSEMTKAELRQLSLDFFLLQLTFQWVPNLDVTDYDVTYGSFKKGLSTKAVYSGMPYQSKGIGSVYRWLEYYDEATATLDLERAFAENGGYGEGGALVDVETDANGNITYKKYVSFMTMFNQCSSSSFWGWARVINSADFSFTCDMNVYNGFIPVGCYTYPNMETLDLFGYKTAANPTGYDVDDVIRDWNAQNGEDAMFKCYAKLKPADLLVSPGHTLMVKSVDLVKREDGTINYLTSSITVQEQVEKWARQTMLGTSRYYRQGETENVYSFSQLQKQNYMPLTFAEYLDENDPQDREHLNFYREHIEPRSPLSKEYHLFTFTDEQVKEMSGVGVEKGRVFCTAESGKAISLADFKEMAVGSNYSISDVFVTVKDASGKEVFKSVYRAQIVREREVPMSARKSTLEKDEAGNYLPLTHGMEEFANGSHTVDVTLQISTGEKLVAFTGTLEA